MRNFSWITKSLTLTLLALGLEFSSLIPIFLDSNSAIAATSIIEVKKKAKAKEVTVLIQSLQNDQFGSGVIVRKDRNTYTILTTNHVLSGSNSFTVRTFDGVNYTLSNIQRVPGVDMAIGTFESSKIYTAALIGDSNQLQAGVATFVSGYPQPSKAIPKPLWQITGGAITSLNQQSSPAGSEKGYAITYGNETRPGMAGGPVFNESGELIAIHGKTRGDYGAWVSQGVPINLYKTAYKTASFTSPPTPNPQLNQGSIVLPPADLILAEPPVSPVSRPSPAPSSLPGSPPKPVAPTQAIMIPKPPQQSKATLGNRNRDIARTSVSPTQVRSEIRSALIIGNSDYQQVSKLSNPVHDAEDLAMALKDLGFDVTLLKDADYRQMGRELDDFSQKLQNGGIGVFYYAGHGIQFEGENYLIPVDAKLSRYTDIRYETLPVGKVLNVMEEAKNNANILILDACRNNPFKRKWASSSRDISEGGLGFDAFVKGSYIAYAAAPGRVALDGQERNGTFTSHLLKNIKTPNLSVEELFKRVRAGVSEETNDRQVPWDSSSLVGSFSFNPK